MPYYSVVWYGVYYGRTSGRGAIVMVSYEWEVLTADYIGDGKWEPNTPLVFDSEDEAIEYVKLINANNQLRVSKRVLHVKQIG